MLLFVKTEKYQVDEKSFFNVAANQKTINYDSKPGEGLLSKGKGLGGT